MVGGILLGLFIVFLGIMIAAIVYKKLNGNNISIFIILYVLYIIAYITIFSILSDKLKRYNDNIIQKTYKDSTSIKNDFEELKKLVYAYLFLAFSIILVIMISYKNLYGDYYFYREYAITVVGLFIFYISYVAYNEFIV
jgi:apolipoprotein N-acyltransferase